MRALLPHPRAGLTLLELLVVLVILAITTALVPLAWRSPRATGESALDGLTQTARRAAIRRGEELRLRVDADGAWVLAAREGTDVLETGRIAAPAAPVSLRVDALGTCRPGGDIAATGHAASGVSFDMLGCRFLSIAAPGASPTGATR
ncbi:prepilin-type N-terminal cleavage/methylation domain-containing protein [Gemmatimonas sp.]|uniref:prepilin-type N-terminal cleavage/methylation domain-containing protein n=1 Tax=Gemmatimonas sp. TaxID=1962908 RepID=UPI00286A12F7|nr:prepilin-type N-terminal cleavage/methylation domain-containing protein [Gemmatimonas sp.]